MQKNIMFDNAGKTYLYLSILGILFEAFLRFILSACPSSYNAHVLDTPTLFAFAVFFFTMYVSFLCRPFSPIPVLPLSPLWIALDHIYLRVVGIGHYMAVYGPLFCNNLAHNWQHYRLTTFQCLTFIIITLPPFSLLNIKIYQTEELLYLLSRGWIIE